jgi:hypothetical protein
MLEANDLIRALERYYGKRHHYSVEQIRMAVALVNASQVARETIHE